MMINLKDLIHLIGCVDQTIVLLDFNGACGWLGSFPADYVPKEYEDYKVKSIMPDEFEGEGFGDGCVLKVWVDE